MPRSKMRRFLCVGAVLSALALAGLASARTAARWLSSFERVAEIAETQGPAAALESSASALDRRSESLALLLQYVELLVETKGVPRSRDLLELRRASLPSTHFRIAEALCDRSTGRIRAARRVWASLDSSSFGEIHGLDRWALDLERLAVGVEPESTRTWTARVASVAGNIGGIVERLTRARLASLRARGGQDPGALVVRAEDGLGWTRSRQLLLRARLHGLRGDVDRAERDYRACADLSDSMGAVRTGALSGSYFGLLLDEQSRYLEATDVRRRAVEVFDSLDDSLALAYALMGLGWDLDRTTSSRESIEATTRALELWIAMANRWGQAQALNNLGVAHFGADQWVSASNCYHRGLEIVEESQNVDQRLMLLNNVALLESRRGRPDRAVEIYREILEIHRQRQNVVDQMDVLNNLGLACMKLGESEQARDYFRIGIALGEEQGLIRVASMTNLAMILADEGELEEARSLLSRAGRAAAEQGDRGALASVLAWMGRVEQRAGDAPAALRYLSSADSLQRLRGELATRITTLIRRSTVEVQLEDLEGARASAQRAQEMSEKLADPSLSAASHTARAMAERAAGNIELARRFARSALAIWMEDLLRDTSFTDSSGIKVAAIEALRVLVATLPPVEDSKREIARAELLRYCMGVLNRERDHTASVSEADLDSTRRRERRLREEFEALRDRPRQSSVLPASRQWELADAETAWNAARRELVGALGASKTSIDPADEAVLRSRLDERTLLLAYLMGPTLPGVDRAPVLRLWMDSRHPLRIELIEDERTLRRRLDLWRSLTSRPSRDEIERRAEQRIAAGLAESLLPAEFREDAGGRHLVVAADGALSVMSFAGLVLAESDSARLAELVTIQRSTSWDTWSQQELGLGTGDSSPQEVLRADPTRLAAAVRSQEPWPHAGILHVDSHGYFDPRRPWLSGLYRDDPRQGESSVEPFLQLADLPMLRLENRLVTLAACETAQREDSALHSSVQSFAAALQNSGARAVLGSSWEVDSELAAWTTNRVYEQLSRGATLSGALRAAQIALIKDPRTADPFYWAGWQVMGDGAQRIPLEMRRAPRKAWAWWGLSTLLAALAFGLWRRST